MRVLWARLLEGLAAVEHWTSIRFFARMCSYVILKRTHRLASPTTVLANVIAFARCVRYRFLLLHRWLLHLLLWHTIIYRSCWTAIRLLLLLIKNIQISLRYSFAPSMLSPSLDYIINGCLLTFNSRCRIILLLLLLVWLLLLLFLLFMVFVSFRYSLSLWSLLLNNLIDLDNFPLWYSKFSLRELL